MTGIGQLLHRREALGKGGVPSGANMVRAQLGVGGPPLTPNGCRGRDPLRATSS